MPFHIQGRRKVSSAPLFDPTQLTGKLAIFIADPANLLLGAGNTVISWADLSGHSNNAIPGTNAPTFNSSGLNGQGVINFANKFGDGTAAGQALQISNTVAFFSQTRGTTVYMVLKNAQPSFNETFLFNGQMDAGGYPGLEFYNTGGFDGFIFTGTMTDVPTPLYFAASPSASTYHIVDLEHDGTGWTSTSGAAMYLDRALLSTATGPTYRDYADANLIANYDKNGENGYGLQGSIAAIIVVDHALSITERTNLNAWVLRKYGI